MSEWGRHDNSVIYRKICTVFKITNQSFFVENESKLTLASGEGVIKT